MRECGYVLSCEEPFVLVEVYKNRSCCGGTGNCHELRKALRLKAFIGKNKPQKGDMVIVYNSRYGLWVQLFLMILLPAFLFSLSYNLITSFENEIFRVLFSLLIACSSYLFSLLWKGKSWAYPYVSEICPRVFTPKIL